ncbi:MAG: hypothetical protein ABIQ09_09525 [Jatrophihabitantaceae bacterium]
MTELSGDTEQLALSACRLALNPARGRLGRPHHVGIAVRAALFTELAGSGRLVGLHHPQAIGESDTGNPLPDALHRAVAGRRPVAWRRWYSHVDADRRAATDALIRAGRWRLEGRRLIDIDPASTVLQQRRVAELLGAKQAPDTLDLTLLVLLAGGYGAGSLRPGPKRSRRLTRPWLEPHLLTSGHGGDATLAALRAAFRAMRRANSIPFTSR